MTVIRQYTAPWKRIKQPPQDTESVKGRPMALNELLKMAGATSTAATDVVTEERPFVPSGALAELPGIRGEVKMEALPSDFKPDEKAQEKAALDLLQKQFGYSDKDIQMMKSERTARDIIRLVGEVLVLKGLPSATAGFKALGTASPVAKYIGRTALAPIAGAEQVIAAPFKLARAELGVLLDAGLDKWIATQGRTPEAQSALGKLIVGKRTKLIEWATNNLKRRMAERRPTPEAVRAAVDDTIKDVEKNILPEFSRTRTDLTVQGIKAGKYEPAPSLKAIQGVTAELKPKGGKKLKHTVELHREYIAIGDKPVSDMTPHELQVVRTETPSFSELEAVEQELKRRGTIKTTGQESITQMTGGKIIEDQPPVQGVTPEVAPIQEAENVIAGKPIFTSSAQKAATDGETIYINTSTKFQTEVEIDKFFADYKGTIVAKDLERARRIISNTREGVIAHEQGHSFSDGLTRTPFGAKLYTAINKIYNAEETAVRAKKAIGRPPLLSTGLTRGENLNVASEEVPQQYALYITNPELQKKYYPEIYKLFNENKTLVRKYDLPVKDIKPTEPPKGVTEQAASPTISGTPARVPKATTTTSQVTAKTFTTYQGDTVAIGEMVNYGAFGDRGLLVGGTNEDALVKPMQTKDGVLIGFKEPVSVKNTVRKIHEPPTLSPAETAVIKSEIGKLTAIPTPQVTPPAGIPKADISQPPAITTPQGAAEKVKAVTEKAKVAPKSVKADDAEFAHIEGAAPDGPQPPKPPKPTAKGLPEPARPDKPLSEILGNAPQGERPDQTLLRVHEAARNNIVRQSNIVVEEGSKKLKALGIGVTKRGQLVPKESDKPKLLELYNALHNPSKVASGEIKIPEGYQEVYNELRGLADWDTASRIDFDPKAAVIDDWFFRGWKPPEGMYPSVAQGRLGVKPKPLRMPRVNASFEEMVDHGFEPLFWNPYQQWAYRHRLGELYREQMQLIKWLKGMGEDFARPDTGGITPQAWRVPRIGPAFEGKPFATTSMDGEPVVMFTRRWIVPERIAEALENIYGKRPTLGKVFLGKLQIDPTQIIDTLTFLPKRAKLLFSLFQQIDFLTRSGAGSWTGAVDMLWAGKPVEAAKSVIRYPKVAGEIIRANLSPGQRLSLLKQLDDTTPLVSGRTGVHFKGISEQGLSTMDVTIFAEDMDKLMRSLPDSTGLWKKIKGIPSSLVDLESAMRRGLFNGTYPAAMLTDIKYNIAQIFARQFPSSTDTQLNAMIAKSANIKYSTIPPSQSVFQNAVLREVLRRLFFSVGESEGLLRQAVGAFHGPHASFWRKHWAGVYLFLIATANIIHYASTREPLPLDRYSPVAKDDWGPLPFGYNTKFASPTIPLKGRGDTEITLDLVGQMDTAFRVLDPGFFLSSRTSVPIRAIENQVTGTDFYGAPIDDVGPGGVFSRTSQMVQDLFAPIGVGGIMVEAGRQYIPGGKELITEGESRLGLGGLGIQATGVNLRSEWTGDFLDRKAKESGMKKADGSLVERWQDLEPYQKDKLLEDKELIKELAARRETSLERNMPGAAGYAEKESLEQQRITRGEYLVTEFENGDFDANTFRDEVSTLKVEIAAKKAQVDEDFQLFLDTGELPDDPNKKALVEYYNLYDKARRQSQSIDWEKFEQLENELRVSWTASQEAYVDRNTSLTEWGMKMQVFVDDQQTLQDSGYWDIPDPLQSQKRQQFRVMHPQIDKILVKWYGYKPVSGGEPTKTPVTSGSTGGTYIAPWKR